MTRSELPLQSRAALRLSWALGSFASVGPFLPKRLKFIWHDCLTIKTNVITVLPTKSALVWRSQENDLNRRERCSQRKAEEVTLSLREHARPEAGSRRLRNNWLSSPGQGIWRAEPHDICNLVYWVTENLLEVTDELRGTTFHCLELREKGGTGGFKIETNNWA